MLLDEMIFHLIKTRSIPDQKTFLHLLRENGFEVNQSTLSRHLKKMNVSKNLGKYIILDQELKIGSIFQVSVVEPNLIVIKTSVGSGQAFAVQIDGMKLPSVVACVACDDTIFVAVSPPKNLERTAGLLRQRLKY